MQIPQVSELAPDQAPLRVLIAEDETLIRLDLAETLIELGMEVIGAVANGHLAVAQWLTGRLPVPHANHRHPSGV
jgi:hypothetical protein